MQDFPGRYRGKRSVSKMVWILFYHSQALLPWPLFFLTPLSYHFLTYKSEKPIPILQFIMRTKIISLKHPAQYLMNSKCPVKEDSTGHVQRIKCWGLYLPFGLQSRDALGLISLGPEEEEWKLQGPVGQVGSHWTVLTLRGQWEWPQWFSCSECPRWACKTFLP